MEQKILLSLISSQCLGKVWLLQSSNNLTNTHAAENKKPICFHPDVTDLDKTMQTFHVTKDNQQVLYRDISKLGYGSFYAVTLLVSSLFLSYNSV